LSPYSTAWRSRNIVHDLIGGGIAVSLIAPRPRGGTLDLLYPDEETAYAAVTLHLEETAFTLSETDRPHVSMTYVLDGEVTIRLDEDTLEMFVVSVGFQEVIP
jgi:hypothetical protein